MLIEEVGKVPFTLLYAEEPEIQLLDPEGRYDVQSQRWIGNDIKMTTTWCRSTTTGTFTSDPDEDKDD